MGFKRFPTVLYTVTASHCLITSRNHAADRSDMLCFELVFPGRKDKVLTTRPNVNERHSLSPDYPGTKRQYKNGAKRIRANFMMNALVSGAFFTVIIIIAAIFIIVFILIFPSGLFSPSGARTSWRHFVTSQRPIIPCRLMTPIIGLEAPF